MPVFFLSKGTSHTGRGSHMEKVMVPEEWTSQRGDIHITHLEMRAVMKALQLSRRGS